MMLAFVDDVSVEVLVPWMGVPEEETEEDRNSSSLISPSSLASPSAAICEVVWSTVCILLEVFFGLLGGS